MKTEYQISIIDKIRQLRHENHDTQVDVSIILGTSTGQIGNIETPKASHKYTLRQIFVLCEHYKIPLTNIFLSEAEAMLSEEEKIHTLIKNIVEYEQ